jgi:ADP-ribose pyrophosphatase YjhB (NUDIX family)
MTMTTQTVDQDQQEGRAETATLTVDVVVIDVDPAGIASPRVLLIKRRWSPYADCWALPGGGVNPDEDLFDAAARELAEETGLRLDADELEHVAAYGDPGRDPRGRVVSFAYVATVTDGPEVTGQDDAVTAQWWPLDDVFNGCLRLAFDHAAIVAEAVAAWGTR